MTVIFPSNLRGGGVGTLVEPAKNEPRETACRMAEGVKRSEKAQNVHPLREGELLLIVIPNCGFWQEWSDSETRPREGCVEPADLPIIQDMFRNLLNF